MTVARTTLLDLPIITTGTESGLWGDYTNNGLTQYLDIAIAGITSLTSANFTAGALTIETTEGTNSATNIVATSAQYATIRVSSLAVNSTITVGNTGTNPGRSYRLINDDSTYTLTFKATGQTGVTLQPGQSAVVAFNGTDYALVGTIGPTVPVARGGTGATTLTANNVILGNGTSAVQFVAPGTNGNVLTSNGTTWASSAPVAGGVVRSARTSNTILGTADKGNLIAITSGTFTQTFTAAATLGSGWWCYIQNLGTGDITLDPNSSETIDGLTSYIMYPNEVRLVQCNGSNFFTIVIQPFYKTITTTGSFTFPPGYGSYGGVVIGAGGGGQGGLGWTAGNTRDGGSGGGGGGLVPFAGLIATAGSTVTATVGAGSNGSAGGTGGTPASVPSTGGSSSLGNYVTATGGGGSGSGGGATDNRVSYIVDATTTYSFGFAADNSNAFGTFGAGQVAAGNVNYTSGRGGGSEYGGSGGGKNSSSSAGMSAAGRSLFGPTGAGSGGGVSAANSAWAGSAGGGVGYSNTPAQAGGGAAGGSGAAGTAGSVLGSLYAPGGGGGGGGGNAAGTGYAGGNGAAPGGGGGGGGGGLTTGGAGGNGARGEVRVWGCA